MDYSLSSQKQNYTHKQSFLAYALFISASIISLSFFWYGRIIGHIGWTHLLLSLSVGTIIPIFSSYFFIINTRDHFFRTHLLWLIRTYWYAVFYGLALFVFSWMGLLYKSETAGGHALHVITLTFQEGFTLGAAILSIWYLYRQLLGFSMLLAGQTPSEISLYKEE